MVSRTDETPNPEAQKNKTIHSGRGKYPDRGSTHGMHTTHDRWDVDSRAQEMKGFKGDKHKWAE